MFKHLVVPLDGSDLAEKALPAALELAEKFKSTVTLVYVAEIPHIIAEAGSRVETKGVYDLREAPYKEAINYINCLESSLDEQGYSVKSKIVKGFQVSDAILHAVEQVNADTIVMSTHGRSGVSRWLYGSIADQLLHHTNVPVLLIRCEE